MNRIDWVTTIATIIGAVLGEGVAANVDFLNDFVTFAQTSVGTILSMVVGGGLGSLVGGALKGQQ